VGWKGGGGGTKGGTWWETETEVLPRHFSSLGNWATMEKELYLLCPSLLVKRTAQRE